MNENKPSLAVVNSNSEEHKARRRKKPSSAIEALTAHANSARKELAQVLALAAAIRKEMENGGDEHVAQALEDAMTEAQFELETAAYQYRNAAVEVREAWAAGDEP